MQAQDWLKQFTDPAANQIDGRVLYRYRISDDEFFSLQETLKTSAALGVAHLTRLSGWNAALVIYAAEWWRRNYQGGAWSWSVIFASLDAKATDLNAEQLNLAVELGLGYWQRPIRIINGRSHYLGTIATEGGLPVKQLDNINGLGKLFKHVIPKYLRLQNADVIDAFNIIRAYADAQLANSDSNELIYTILADMVYLLAQLKMADKNLYPHDLFSLPIDNPIAHALLSDMINTAVQVVSPVAPFWASRRLLLAEGMRLTFEFATFVDLANFSNADDFPSRVAVEIISDQGDSCLVGMALKTTLNHKAVLKMPRCSLPAIEGVAATWAYSLRFKQLSNTLAEQPLIEAIDDSVPWTFAQSNDEWALIGTASVQTRSEWVCILYPSHLTYLATQVIGLATLADKQLIKASGTIELRDADSCFCIQTAQAEEAARRYYLQGNRLGFPSNPKTVFLGIPELWCVDSKTEQRLKVDTPLLARAINSKQWQILTTKHQGIYELRLQDAQGKVQFYQRCALLAENFALRFSNGRIDIDHSEHAYIFCESPLVSRINATADSRAIEFNAANNTPSSLVNLILRWGRNDGMTLTVPYPKLECQLIVDALRGVYLRLLGEHKQRHLTLKFALKDDSLKVSDLYFRDDLVTTGAVIELALSDYQQWLNELLAISHHPDRFVCLTVYEHNVELLRSDIIPPAQPLIQAINRTRQVHTLAEISNLADAQTIYDDSLRALFIRHRLKQLCIDFAADDWNTLREQQTDTPLANEIWRAASLESRVLVALALQLESAFMMELSVCWELIPVKDWLVVFTRYKNYLAQTLEQADVKAVLSQRINKITALAQTLNIIAQWLKYQLCDEVDNELLFMQTAEARLLIIEQLEHEQQDLNQRQANRIWLDFLHEELIADWQKLPLQTQGLLTQHTDAVTLLPLLVAHFALTAMPTTWQNSVYLFKITQLKAFDEHWFNTAFTLLLAYLSQQPDYLQPLLQETAAMIHTDENDLVTEIEQQLALANREVRALETDVQTLQGGTEALEALLLENQELNANIDSLTAIIKKRDDSLRLLLDEVTKLNAKIRDIRSELQVKNQ